MREVVQKTLKRHRTGLMVMTAVNAVVPMVVTSFEAKQVPKMHKALTQRIQSGEEKVV